MLNTFCYDSRLIVICLLLSSSRPKAHGYNFAVPRSEVPEPPSEAEENVWLPEKQSIQAEVVNGSTTFRMPRRIHAYSNSASSMYLAQESPFVAPRAFKVEQLPSTPQLNSIMDRAMGKVKRLLNELETDKGGIKPLPKKATRNVTMAALLIEEVTRSLAKE